MVPPDSAAEPKPWIGVALAALLIFSFALRTWDASQKLNASRYYDERYPFRNISALLKEGQLRPRNAFYLSLSYLPQAAVLAASESLYRVTHYPPFSIYATTTSGYSSTAYWLSRIINVLYSTLSLWLLFRIGRRIYSPEVGLLAAAILAAFHRHLQSSVEFKPDILVVLLVLLTFAWTLSAALQPRLARYLLVGFGIGLAVSAKYTGIAAALPITAAAALGGWRDRRQWGWLGLAGLSSIATFVALNPFLGVIFRFIPRMTQSYAWRGTESKSNHWVVFQRQIGFLIDQHEPVVAVFVALGIVGLLWRAARPAPEDSRERRLGTLLVLSLVLGYSLLHALGTSLFKGQNYLPVVPFTSLAAGWSMVELARALARRAHWLAWWPAAALAWLLAGGALLAQQGTLVYNRIVPTTFERANELLLTSSLEPYGLRHVVYEQELGPFRAGGRPRRPLVTLTRRLADVDPLFLDRADVEMFLQARLAGPQAPFYRGRLARVPRAAVEVVRHELFRSRGAPVVIVRHLWSLAGQPQELRVRRPEGAGFLVGRFPEGLPGPAGLASFVLWLPREVGDHEASQLRLDPGDRAVPVYDTGRRLNRFFRTSPRLQLTGREVRVRIPSAPEDRPRGFALEIYRWRPPAGT